MTGPFPRTWTWTWNGPDQTPRRRLVASRSPAEIKAMKDRGALENSPVHMEDFLQAVRNIRPSVNADEMRRYGGPAGPAQGVGDWVEILWLRPGPGPGPSRTLDAGG